MRAVGRIFPTRQQRDREMAHYSRRPTPPRGGTVEFRPFEHTFTKHGVELTAYGFVMITTTGEEVQDGA